MFLIAGIYAKNIKYDIDIILNDVYYLSLNKTKVTYVLNIIICSALYSQQNVILVFVIMFILGENIWFNNIIQLYLQSFLC